jgi:amino acid permease
MEKIMLYILFIVTAVIMYFGGKSDLRRQIQKEIKNTGKFSIGKEVYQCNKVE